MFTRRKLKIPNPPASVTGGVLEEAIQRLNALEKANYEQWRELQRFLRGLNDGGALGVAPSWTPALTIATPGDASITYTTQLGQVVNFGPLSLILFDIVTNTFTHTTASGSVTITGNSVPNRALTLQAGSMLWGGITKANYTHCYPYMSTGSKTIAMAASGSGQAAADLAITDMPTGGTVRLRGSILVLS